MNFLTYGDKSKQSILFIHGMASTALLCYEPLLEKLNNYYVILAEVDGHSDNLGELESLADNCTEIEQFIIENLDGKIYCLSGFSMGGTMAVEIVGRGNVKISKLLLDAAFLTKMGSLTKMYEKLFCKGISRMQQGKKIPKLLMDFIMGKDNNSVVEMLYTKVTSKTIINVCEYVYRYEIPKEIQRYTGQVEFWHGSNEPYPKKSAKLLKEYLPQLKEIEFDNMGHGQFLHERSSEYAEKIIDYLNQ
ncbi:MAG: alpha/beta hydrolase [Pseudobutyrivibrio sp.]|nr:alpha/beta hydrolase [Pseudobutyrivibrio sp.]